jgi:metal-responsive CopG/Arc/MetJ family transcriptional regulator
MGRPQVKEVKQQVTIMLEPSVVEEIDRIAAEYGLTRSSFIANLTKMGLDEAKMLEKVGVLKFVQIADNVKLKFKEAVVRGKVSLDGKGNLVIAK